MINIVVAFKDEARPFIRGLSLRPQPGAGAGGNAFPLYRRGGVRLIISGMGAENAAAATRFLRAHGPAAAATRWLNFGIAGSAQFEIGAVVMASRVCGPRSGERWSCYRPPSMGLPDAVVRTVEQPETRYGWSGVYDMEAAGICRAVGASRCEAGVVCIKLVTDGPGRPVSRLKRKTVRGMLESLGPQPAAWLDGVGNAR